MADRPPWGGVSEAVKRGVRRARARECTVFFRDDDVDKLSGNLTEFVDFFLQQRVPVNYQIVPGKFEDDACEFILGKRRDHPELIRLNQHGFMHEYVSDGVHTWSEYAGKRAYEDQYESIQSGRRILQEKLGPHFDHRVFTPPAHKYDENTLRALDALGFEILSASSYSSFHARAYYRVGKLLRRTSLLGKRVSYNRQRLPGHGLREISVSVDVDMNSGKPIAKTASTLIDEFQRARHSSPVVGIVLHHNCYNPAKFDVLRDFVRLLRSTPGLSFRLIEDAADELSTT